MLRDWCSKVVLSVLSSGINAEYGGLEWKSTEHYFQAHKFTSPDYFEKIRLSATPGEAKELGSARRPDYRKDWQSIRDECMLAAVRAKFAADPALARVLVGTRALKLVEWSSSDPYWGTGPDGGSNMLGQILMQVRDELIKKGSAS
eukprot:TRINITY_DN1702_c0_g2_i3.p1 TRINITY_DN1702_c0_g2~~TRINITY_DN1702_c0_g2_i3.p1  ORF type:complete len:146 (+),score=48.25 TRINITY_DN1702_c0_g2_i3:82-519(+)